MKTRRVPFFFFSQAGRSARRDGQRYPDISESRSWQIAVMKFVTDH